MPLKPNENHRARDLPSECGLADQERPARRKLNAAHIAGGEQFGDIVPPGASRESTQELNHIMRAHGT